MRLPRMTTRRWMIAVAVVALSFGSLYMKRKRDRCLARASWHTSRRAEAILELTRVPAFRARPDPAPAPEASNELAWRIDRMLGRPTAGWSPFEGDDRSREDQEVIEHAIEASRRRLLAEYRRRVSGRLRKQADYHAALAGKYREAASHPWLSVPPDPPEPK